MESLDLDDLVLIGHSMGGRNALFYAVGIPEKVSCLVLIDSRPGNSAEIPHATHVPVQENPDAFYKLVSDFLSEL